MDISAALRSPFAALFLRPSYDRIAVPALARLYFPLSRAWAAGLAAGGDVQSLIDRVPELAGRRAAAARALERLSALARAHGRADALWHEALFGAGDPGAGALARLEDERAGTAQDLMLGRLAFLRLHLATHLAPVDWDIATPDAVAARHGWRRASPDRAFAIPEAEDAVALSRPIPDDVTAIQWLRAPSEAGGVPDTLWARIDRPAAEGPCPALIFTHGICMESEYWHDSWSPAIELAAEGLAVIRPEGPWHGRRRREGRYGGEPILSEGPMGLLDYFAAHLGELGRLTAWARRTYGGPVAVGGVSLGALTAQLIASAARHWPAAARPDALILITTSASLMNVAMEGTLPRALGTPAALRAHGWDHDALAAWLPLLEPDDGPPAVAPERIVALLGTRDRITPYADGARLMRRWRVPEANVFCKSLGHFTTSLGLYRDPAPFARLREVLSAG